MGSGLGMVLRRVLTLALTPTLTLTLTLALTLTYNPNPSPIQEPEWNLATSWCRTRA